MNLRVVVCMLGIVLFLLVGFLFVLVVVGVFVGELDHVCVFIVSVVVVALVGGVLVWIYCRVAVMVGGRFDYF